MLPVITFEVIGIPAPQGSKTPWGSEANPNTRPWRAAIAAAAAEAMKGAEPLAGAVSLWVRFVFPRPKGHYGTGKNAAKLKASAPFHVAKKPDLDKLVRAVCDGMSGIVFRDDSQVAILSAAKFFGAIGTPWLEPGVAVKATELTTTYAETIIEEEAV
jgi:Holliday junction resolvase RusA-like endonuclease